MFVTGILIGITIIFEAVLIGRMLVRYKQMEKVEAEKRKNWNNAWV